MRALMQGCFWCGIACLHFARGDYANDDQSKCDASFRHGDDQNIALLQVGDQRSSLKGSALQSSASGFDPGSVDPDKDRLELMCYLKSKVQEAFTNQVKPLADSPLQTLHPLTRLRTKKCAAVSSSGALLKNRYGPRIDTADVTLRFNNAPFSGFERHVGKKENLRFTNQFFAKYAFEKQVNITPKSSYILLNSPPHDRMIARMYPESHFYTYPWDLMMLATDTMKGLYSKRWTELGQGRANLVTTGCLGMLLALSFCESVETFEFAASDNAGSSKYKYYGKYQAGPSASDNEFHSWFEAEHDMWKRLSVNSTADIAKTGRALIQGFNAIDCENVSHTPSFASFLSDSEPQDSSRREWNLI